MFFFFAEFAIWVLRLAFSVVEEESFSSSPSVNGFKRSNMVSSTSFSRPRSSLAIEESMDRHTFCLVTATRGPKFPFLLSITLLLLNNLGVFSVGYE